MNIREKVVNELTTLYEGNARFLPDHSWQLETDRWEELIRCLLIDGTGLWPDAAIKAIQILNDLGISSVEQLAESNKDTKLHIVKVFVQCGLNEEEAGKWSEVLISIARNVSQRWSGHIQRLLREHGKNMLENLKAEITVPGFNGRKAERVATLWLQM